MRDPRFETLRAVQAGERKMDLWKIEVRITGHQPRGDKSCPHHRGSAYSAKRSRLWLNNSCLCVYDSVGKSAS